MDWPNDADGDVLRSLESKGFDFDQVHDIDFNIDFKEWPITEEAIATISKNYPRYEVIEPDEEDIANGDLIGYVQFQVTEKLTYELVIDLQASVTKTMKPFGGYCESWGLLS